MRQSVFLLKILFLLVGLILVSNINAQNLTITGRVTDAENGESIPSVSIVIKGTTNGTITDFNGNYSVQTKVGDVLVYSFIGYSAQEVTITNQKVINIVLESETIGMNEVVVIGYGEQKRGDLTGSVAAVSSKDFKKGVMSTPAELINGKVSGVQIMSGNGSPTSGSTIRIRGGASLNASNDPLIVLDGVPLESGGITGNNSNFLSLINPNDIESMTVLKDASSTAIYGSRASNGVIIITTKKGTNDKLKIDVSSTNSLQFKTKLADMLSNGEFNNVVITEGSADQIALLGNEHTDWNDQIYQVAFGTDNNVSMAGSLYETPYRFSAGFYNQDGIIKSDNAKRFSSSFTVSPSFFDDHLKLNVGYKLSYNKNQFANTGAIWAAATYNPTLAVMSGNDLFGGYSEAIDNNGVPVTSAVLNPVGMLNQYSSTSDVIRTIGNFDLDYKFHFLPELKFHTTLGYDYAEGEGDIYVPATAVQYYSSDGRDYSYGPQKKENRLLTTYLSYVKNFDALNSKIDVTAGYDYQFWKSTSPYYEVFNTLSEKQSSVAASDQRHVLISFYGRMNYVLLSRYMITATVRRDGSSRFGEDYNSGTFPSFALAWRLSEESFMKGISALSNLKLRVSYGETGQQDGIGNYGYLPVYTISQDGAQYRFGDEIVNTYRPEAYVKALTWESTEAYNYGVDFGFFKNRLSGTVEYYTRKTKNLLATVSSPAGTNFDTKITTNVGNVDSEGVEVSLNGTPVDNKNWTWDLSVNATWQKQIVKNLSNIKGQPAESSPTGPTIDGKTVLRLAEGYSPNMFYVKRQLYDGNGTPIEGAYASVNGEEFYYYNSPTPDYILGFSTSLRYKKWSLSTSLRANIGNYVYNGMAMNTGAFGTMSYNAYQLNNLHSSYLETKFQSRQYYSDYYVENASFLKMDNFTIGYNFGRINDMFGLNISAMIQNVFTVTKYTGVDPEVPNGMDNSFYPRPRIFSLSVGMEF
ncbi:MAG: TonB-dependent receptor [Marinilabiliaceae bacterium]|nr:TonB-dependent receptor [Marinilabiliaceae bacterium]